MVPLLITTFLCGVTKKNPRHAATRNRTSCRCSDQWPLSHGSPQPPEQLLWWPLTIHTCIYIHCGAVVRTSPGVPEDRCPRFKSWVEIDHVCIYSTPAISLSSVVLTVWLTTGYTLLEPTVKFQSTLWSSWELSLSPHQPSLRLDIVWDTPSTLAYKLVAMISIGR